MKSTAPRASIGFFNNLQIFTSVNLILFHIGGYQVSCAYCQVSFFPSQGDFNEYQHDFLENYPSIIIRYPLNFVHCTCIKLAVKA